MYIHIYIYIKKHIWIHIYICINLWTYTYTYTICIYIYTYVQYTNKNTPALSFVRGGMVCGVTRPLLSTPFVNQFDTPTISHASATRKCQERDRQKEREERDQSDKPTVHHTQMQHASVMRETENERDVTNSTRLQYTTLACQYTPTFSSTSHHTQVRQGKFSEHSARC